jgi:uridine kinase
METAKLLIGITGPPAAGKEAVSGIIAAALQKRDIGTLRFTFSTVLYRMLRDIGLSEDRRNAQALVVAIKNHLGKDTLALAVQRIVVESAEPCIILDGVRWPPDEQFIREFPNNVVIAVSACERKRFERTRSRRQKAGEENMTWERFLIEERAEAERFIPDIASRADVVVHNDGTLDDLSERLMAIVEGIILPRITS